jgi:hypothetical protein
MHHKDGNLIGLYGRGTTEDEILNDLRAWIARRDRRRFAKQEALVARQKQIIANLDAHGRAPRRAERERRLLLTMEEDLAALYANLSLDRNQG